MDEVLEFCRRVLGTEELAQAAAEQAGSSAADERMARLAHASRACRELAERAGPQVLPGAGHPARDLSEAVSGELAAANAELPERQREALALRELLALDYEQVGAVMGLEATAVGPLLARARLRLRTELRGPMPVSDAACSAGDRALVQLARRQDGEAVGEDEEAWLLDHLAECDHCERVHAAMLEASVCYRVWPVGERSRIST